MTQDPVLVAYGSTRGGTKTRAGDFRNAERVAVWAADIATRLTCQTRPTRKD
ncbi:hypothetical protein [Nocardia sp. BMG51109]|uniref:hypothetical protein n=1 Tax=Nocardia sp. BMG51109 TaxID=1056816 RepID=UPI0004B3CF56|nr:hypothetical protein [Nocardia sp. BMG51109]